MPGVSFQLPVVISRLENDHCLGTVLLLPQVVAYQDELRRVQQDLLRCATRLLPELPLLDLHRYRSVSDVTVREIEIDVPPPPARWWSGALPLRLHAVCWNHLETVSIAYLPVLDIEVVVSRGEDLNRIIADHARAALMRNNVIGSLRDLIWLQRTESVRVDVVSRVVEIPSPRQLVEQEHATPQKSVLGEVGLQLIGAASPPVFGLEDVSQKLMDWLYGDSPRSVLLVGPSGVGKTAAVHQLARDCSRLGRHQRPLWSTSGARIVAGMSGFGMWQERCQNVTREAARTQAILHVGNLMELLQVGQYEGNDMGVGEFLRPAIARGELLVIGECTPEELTLLERLAPGMLEILVRLDMQEPSPSASRTLLENAVSAYSHGKDLYVDESALSALDHLHRRYATYSAYPGRPLRFLKNLLADTPGGQVLAAAEVTQAFSRETGLPLHLLDETVPLDLAATRAWFAQRVIGQDEAVDLIVDLLATVKANLARPGKPLASLMFIGPTGVGKTEMAKTLAEFLYQDRQRLTRIDMSEYADPWAIDRLIGAGSRGEGLLTSKVREQPFGVVLLDEFEKAHPRFFDLLLQVLGEGRLTDGAGRLADFRSSVIIMTSNLGVESYARRTPGFSGGDPEEEGTKNHFAAKTQEFLRPEMFNRIDRVVTFLPLSRPVLQDIAGRELELLCYRDGIRYRSVNMAFAEALPAWLVQQCYDPRYGARPLKRAIQRLILSEVAEALNVVRSDRLLEIAVRPALPTPRLSVRTADPAARTSGSALPSVETAEAASAAEAVVQLRRQALRLQNCSSVQELKNDVYRLERAKQRHEVRQRRGPQPAAFGQEARLAALKELAQRVDHIAADAIALEDDVLRRWYTSQPLDASEVAGQVDAQTQPLQTLLLDLYSLQYEQPNYILLIVYGTDASWRNRLAQSYFQLAASRAYELDVYQVLSYSDRPPDLPGRVLLGDRESKDVRLRLQANQTRLVAQRLGSDGSSSPDLSEHATGVALAIRGPGSHLLLASEAGIHSWQWDRSEHQCLVHVSQARIEDYQPPRRIDRREGIGNQPQRRVWNQSRKSIDDRLRPGRVFWSSESLEPFLATLVEQHLMERVHSWANL